MYNDREFLQWMLWICAEYGKWNGHCYDMPVEECVALAIDEFNAYYEASGGV
jgi:hypothetical protein